jgi:hypothetical protein
MTRDKETALQDGKNALHDLGCVERTSYEGGDGGGDMEWHADYRVWPTDECDKHDVAEACENHFGENYILSPSMTEPKHKFLYVTVRTT